ncbi:mevalonate kinase [Candidatus Roizmanbacteria bacterium]|nr:mevalonate kinase [Candidatus Roizmanbacteria bacterium]
MKKISYSAPAKVILSGEHAVVYGKPALVSAIDIRLTVSIIDGKNKKLDTKMEEIILIVKKYLRDKNISIKEKDCHISIQSDIPIGRGLGSSGALSVSAAAALMEFFSGRQYNPEEINNCAYQIEKLFHKNPSGVDPTTSCFGGLIFYRKEFEFLKTISSLHAKIPERIAENLFLIDSGEPHESTAEMVQQVGKLYNNKSKFTEGIFQKIEKITKRMVVSLMKEDSEFFKQTIAENEVLLEKIGVVSSSTKKLLETLHSFGVGKITGAGGKKSSSGYVLFYATEKERLEKYLREKSISYLTFNPSQEGVSKIL